ncbi:TonB-dependent receptor [Chloroherpeton thalassium ATCC 35110]|uniref:TonB-dependent receptor n=1 Tax=Chloroherpeton thalassium (strain ATCC 35110 / GB-78) TaxID=517418 RepID=B3QXE4_CHLT3|nr:TonB-dependent receptor [Chloroherpeton thalassium]ACF13418.1 TonB-dependent receptor [Chloroherpeton thalassium ATCC 35110]
MKKLLLLCVFVATAFMAVAKESKSDDETELLLDSLGSNIGVFSAGEVIVVGKKDNAKETVSSAEIELLDKTDLSKAGNLLPGINLGNSGARNEGLIYIRGFDMRQVPLYIDGIPLYVPYDGYVDPNRFTTFDLSQITISKGYTSVIYGPNTLGGAINMVSRKPEKTFEASARTSLAYGDGKLASEVGSLNLGTNQGLYYVQAGLSILNREFVPLSGSFDATEYEDGGKRDNSSTQDFKSSVKVGYTPNSTDEYTLSYVNQQSEKGVPVYTGNNPSATIRYWKYKDWDKSSLYFIGKKSLGAESSLKARVYYDSYYNVLDSYDDDTYTTQEKKKAFTSIYDDETFGGSLEFATKLSSKNDFTLAVHDKYDKHKEYNVGETPQHFEDNTLSFAAENTYHASDMIRFMLGLRQDFRNSIKAEDMDENDELVSFELEDNSATNFQLGVATKLDERQEISAYISRTTRFPTLKDRYSYRMGSALPNPDLDPEKSWKYGLDYSARFFENLQVQASVYQSQLTDVIQQVDNVAQVDGEWVYQYQNTGEATFTGFECAAEWQPKRWLNAMLGYSYIDQKNDSDPSLKFTGVPRHKLSGYVQYLLDKDKWALLETEYNTKRYSTSDGSYTAGEYIVFNLRANATVLEMLSLQMAVENLFDRNYEISEGYPEPGRQLVISLMYHFL